MKREGFSLVHYYGIPFVASCSIYFEPVCLRLEETWFARFSFFHLLKRLSIIKVNVE